MPKTQDLSKGRNAVSETHARLRRLIVLGTLAPGSPLIERRVADVIGASRTTVRTALQRLEHEGYVVASKIGDRYSRFSVASVTASEMRELYMIFGALDGIAAGLAAQLPREKREEIAREARRLNEELRQTGKVEGPRFERVSVIDEGLHSSYVRAAAGPWLLSEYDRFRPLVERYARFHASALLNELPRAMFDEHKAIIDCIEEGDPAAAEQAAVANWRNAAKRFERVMQDVGELGTFDMGLSSSGGPPATKELREL